MNKIADKEANMVAMRKQFLRDNRERHEVDTTSLKGGSKMTKLLVQMESMNNQRRKD